jgi:hypothetical protein
VLRLHSLCLAEPIAPVGGAFTTAPRIVSSQLTKFVHEHFKVALFRKFLNEAVASTEEFVKLAAHRCAGGEPCRVKAGYLVDA